jgi:hypothetical protein
MPTQKLTDRVLTTGVTLSDLVHIVNPNDLSQNPAGSSYKATIQQLVNLVSGITEPSYTAVTITSSDILNSNSTPFEILPNPGVNNYYDLKIILEYTYNTTSYTSGSDTIITDGTNNVYYIGDVGAFTTDTINILQDIPSVTNQKMYPNLPLSLFTLSADPTTGDGEILLKIWYTIRSLG